MSKTLGKFIKEFPTSYFMAITEEPETRGGAWLESPSLPPAIVFELLEVVYGEYKDLDQKYLFIDNKSTWERYFKTPNGVLRVYDFKGGCSIGYGGTITPELRSDAKKLKETLHEQWKKYEPLKAKIIKETIRANPLINFNRTFLAVFNLLRKARENNSYIEALALYASQVDAMLRLGLILKIQIRDKTDKFDSEYIYQKSKAFKTERSIFKEALDLKLINNSEFKELSRLYDFRNRVIHRYFISDLEYSEIPVYLDRYVAIIDKLGEKLKKLEQEQVKKGVGMTKPDHLDLNDETVRAILRDEHMKINSKKYVTVIPKRKRLFSEEDEDI